MKTKSLSFNIFRSTVVVGVAVYILCASLFISKLHSYFEEQIFNELETECDFLISAIRTVRTVGTLGTIAEKNHDSDNGTVTFLSHIVSKNRITLVEAASGDVVFDNMADAGKMENHALRFEIFSAKENGSSKSSRYSETMTQRTLYFAKLFDFSEDDLSFRPNRVSGEIYSLFSEDISTTLDMTADGTNDTTANSNTTAQYVMRISCNQHSIWVLLLGMSSSLLMCLVIALIISGVLAGLEAKKIANALNKIDLENPDCADVFDEIKPFTKRIAEENFEKKQREILREQFTANVSHELKTPLTSISGFAEIMKTGNVDSKTVADFAEDIYNESGRLITLVNDIIKLSKLDEASLTLQKEKIDLAKMTEEIVATLKPTAEKRNIKIIMNCASPNSNYILGVPSVINEMIYNLIDNAIKYNKDGGSVDISILKENENVVFKISDTGIGIAENELSRIFERFYCVDKSRSKKLGGTGLGLSIVKHGAKYHDAKISVHSELGKGSVFEVRF